MQGKIRAGKTFGEIPFDELFILGVERDNDLWLRAHIGTRDGRKGSAPMGRDYFLSNWELDKNVYSNGANEPQAGPFPGQRQDHRFFLGPRLADLALGFGSASQSPGARGGNRFLCTEKTCAQAITRSMFQRFEDSNRDPSRHAKFQSKSIIEVNRRPDPFFSSLSFFNPSSAHLSYRPIYFRSRHPRVPLYRPVLERSRSCRSA